MDLVAKKRIAILFGGQSTEHAVSCMSAYSVIKNIDKEKFDIVLIGITKNGDWTEVAGEDIESVKDGSWAEKAVTGAGLSGAVGLLEKCDAAFPVLHGLWGEDGTVQGVFELACIPYVGCGVLASSVSMDKAYTKIILKDAGIPQCKHTVVYRNEILSDGGSYISRVENEIGYPCFIKPSNSGSSVGVYKVKNREELDIALYNAQKYDRKIIVEEFIDGREVECAVFGNENPIASTPGEIIPSKEFYDYEDKYKSGTSVVEIPANIPVEKREEIRKYAVKAFKALDCAGLSRVDFFYVRGTGDIILNEINTLPGFTDISMYGKMMNYDGVEFKELITKLIELAFENAENNKRSGE